MLRELEADGYQAHMESLLEYSVFSSIAGPEKAQDRSRVSTPLL